MGLLDNLLSGRGNSAEGSVSEDEQQERQEAGLDPTPSDSGDDGGDGGGGGDTSSSDSSSSGSGDSSGGSSGSGGDGGGGGGSSSSSSSSRSRSGSSTSSSNSTSSPTPEERERQAAERAESTTEAEEDVLGHSTTEGSSDSPMSTSPSTERPAGVDEDEAEAIRQETGRDPSQVVEEDPEPPPGATNEPESGPQVDVRDDTDTSPEPAHANVVQGVEEGSDKVFSRTEDAALELERQVLEENPQLDPEDVAIDLDAGGPSGQGERVLRARLTEEGRETLRLGLEGSIDEDERQEILEAREVASRTNERVDQYDRVKQVRDRNEEEIADANARLEREAAERAVLASAPRDDGGVRARTMAEIRDARARIEQRLAERGINRAADRRQETRQRTAQEIEEATVRLRRQRAERQVTEEFGDIPLRMPERSRTTGLRSSTGGERVEFALNRASQGFQETVRDPVVSFVTEHTEADPSGQTIRGIAMGGTSILNVPATAAGLKEAGEFVVYGGQETAAGRGEEFAEQTGAAALEAGEAAYETAREKPFRTGGQVAGSLLVSAGVIGGAAKVSRTAGRAAAYGIQPGEELVGTVGHGVTRATAGARAADRVFPQQEPIFMSEEAAIRTAKGVGGKARDTLGSATDAATGLASRVNIKPRAGVGAGGFEIEIESGESSSSSRATSGATETSVENDQVQEALRRMDRAQQARSRAAMKRGKRRERRRSRHRSRRERRDVETEDETETEVDRLRRETTVDALERLDEATSPDTGTEELVAVLEESDVDTGPADLEAGRELEDARTQTDVLTELGADLDLDLDTEADLETILGTDVETDTETDVETDFEIKQRTDVGLEAELEEEREQETEAELELETETDLETEATAPLDEDPIQNVPPWLVDETSDVWETGFLDVDEIGQFEDVLEGDIETFGGGRS